MDAIEKEAWNLRYLPARDLKATLALGVTRPEVLRKTITFYEEAAIMGIAHEGALKMLRAALKKTEAVA